MIKLIACDLDGTLLNDAHRLSDRTKTTIQRVQDAGIEFMVATGRDYYSVTPLFDNLNLDCEFLVLNGALITDAKGSPIHQIPMSRKQIVSCAKVFEDNDLCYHMFTSTGNVTSDIARAREEFKVHMRCNGVAEEDIDGMLDETGFCSFEREIQDLDTYLDEGVIIYKMEAFGQGGDRMETARSQLGTKATIAVTNSISNNIEVTHKDAQKGESLRLLCDRLSYKMDEVVVLGDSLNDLNMVELFPHSIAMINGHEIIKNAATYISEKTNDEDGVADILEAIIAKRFPSSL